ncbi:hypothetical protein RMSM_00590 [Rhodopirellula maiorica SM1]|uniref:Uncharacterized protein n=1 Tax=Rhodopirellula maiorica SM1 TaxID=1265738 RepID=M5S4A3_9BACT|nr:hypothetical protein RMSM_00590 [Rhodopirellula maiorica SM1]
MRIKPPLGLNRFRVRVAVTIIATEKKSRDPTSIWRTGGKQKMIRRRGKTSHRRSTILIRAVFASTSSHHVMRFPQSMATLLGLLPRRLTVAWYETM